MSIDTCPIVGRCLKNLDKLIKQRPRTLSEDILPQLQELEIEYLELAAEPEVIRVRGFVAIENMLLILDEVCKRGYRPIDPLPPFQLLQRSWGGLTEMHGRLKELADDLNLDQAELHMGGVKIISDWKGAIALPFDDNLETASSRQARPVLRLHDLCPPLLSAIDLLRPYLRNEQAPVAGIGDSLSSCVRTHYGEFSIESFMSVIRKLIEVRL